MATEKHCMKFTNKLSFIHFIFIYFNNKHFFIYISVMHKKTFKGPYLEVYCESARAGTCLTNELNTAGDCKSNPAGLQNAKIKTSV